MQSGVQIRFAASYGCTLKPWTEKLGKCDQWVVPFREQHPVLQYINNEYTAPPGLFELAKSRFNAAMQSSNSEYQSCIERQNRAESQNTGMRLSIGSQLRGAYRQAGSASARPALASALKVGFSGSGSASSGPETCSTIAKGNFVIDVNIGVTAFGLTQTVPNPISAGFGEGVYVTPYNASSSVSPGSKVASLDIFIYTMKYHPEKLIVSNTAVALGTYRFIHHVLGYAYVSGYSINVPDELRDRMEKDHPSFSVSARNGNLDFPIEYSIAVEDSCGDWFVTESTQGIIYIGNGSHKIKVIALGAKTDIDISVKAFVSGVNSEIGSAHPFGTGDSMVVHPPMISYSPFQPTTGRLCAESEEFHVISPEMNVFQFDEGGVARFDITNPTNIEISVFFRSNGDCFINIPPLQTKKIFLAHGSAESFEIRVSEKTGDYTGPVGLKSWQNISGTTVSEFLVKTKELYKGVFDTSSSFNTGYNNRVLGVPVPYKSLTAFFRFKLKTTQGGNASETYYMDVDYPGILISLGLSYKEYENNGLKRCILAVDKATKKKVINPIDGNSVSIDSFVSKVNSKFSGMTVYSGYTEYIIDKLDYDDYGFLMGSPIASEDEKNLLFFCS